MNEISEVSNDHPYNLKHSSRSSRALRKSLYHGTEDLSYLGPTVWYILQDICKKHRQCKQIQKAIKKQKSGSYPCSICKNTLQISVLHRKQCLN